jgi:[acyl-carrier-protein] S-malonyltransferase
MRHARDEFTKVLEKTPFRDPSIPMVGNVHATMIRSADGLREELSEHLVHGVQWVATVRSMAAIGVTDFVEVGPGRVLTGLIKRISPESNAHALDDAEDGWLPTAPADTRAAPKKRQKPKAQSEL